MPVLDDAAQVLVDIAESVGVDPIDLVEVLEETDQGTELFGILAEETTPTDEFTAVLIDYIEEFILADLQQAGAITPENVEALQDQVEGGAAAVLGGIIAMSIIVETGSLGQIDEVPAEVYQAVLALGVQDVAGREIDARLQNGVDPALKQKVHADHRSKQADFKDFTDANTRTKAFGGGPSTLSGDLPEDFIDLFHPDDFNYLSDPDTYGTVPAQNRLYEAVAMRATEPEELIEEPVQYGIPVPLRAIEQITHIAGLPEDAKSVYTAVIDALPRTENLIQDYVRLTEFNFRLREKVQEGVVSPQRARQLIEPELRDVIKDAVPPDRLRPEDRSADEVVDILADELERNFQLLASLPPDPPTMGDLEAWYQKGVLTANQFERLYTQFGNTAEAFGFYLEESAIDTGWQDVQEQFALDRYSASEARLRLRLIGFSQSEASDILSGADGDTIVQNRFIGADEQSALPVTVATNIGDARGAQLRAVGIDTLSALAEASVEEVSEITGMSDAQSQEAIESAQRLLQGGGE